MSSKAIRALEDASENAPAQISFLRGLTPEQVHLILAAGKFRRFFARSEMTRQGEPADYLFLLWKGRARYFFDTPNGKKLNLQPVTPGNIFGGAALVSGNAAYLLSSEALQDSVALAWESAAIRSFARRFPLLFENALLLAIDHFTWYTSAYASLSSHTARERLAHVLLSLAHAMGHKVLGGVELDLTNEELADSANITPYTASRIVSEWKKMGALHKERGKILIHAPDRLLLGIV